MDVCASAMMCELLSQEHAILAQGSLLTTLNHPDSVLARFLCKEISTRELLAPILGRVGRGAMAVFDTLRR